VNDDAYLQNEPLELRLLDYDSITANDLIGSVYIDLNSLLTDEFKIEDFAGSRSSSDDESSHSSCSNSSSSSTSGIEVGLHGERLRATPDAGDGGQVNSGHSHDDRSEAGRNAVQSSHESFIGETTGVPTTYTRTLGGWFPIYDTVVGIRGELQFQIILQYFGDVNPFNNSSAGIQVFSSPTPSLPQAIKIETLGFISSIATQIDPEYHWTDNFRTPRATNEARVRVLHKLAGLLRRRMGRKAQELGANAIIGYKQSFDFEIEEHTITGRVVGTAVRVGSSHGKRRTTPTAGAMGDMPSPTQAPLPHAVTIGPPPPPLSLMDSQGGQRDRRPSERTSGSSDSESDRGSETSSIGTKSTGSSLSTSSLQSADNARNQKKAAACEILTFKAFPPGMIHRLGGLVSATSIKLLENDQSRTRELWFDDLRAEIKHHALAIGCSHIIGYNEQVTIRDEIIVLIAYGTAAVLELNAELPAIPDQIMHQLPEHSDDHILEHPVSVHNNTGKQTQPMTPLDTHQTQQNQQQHQHLKPLGCRMCHASHDRLQLPYPMRFFRCGFCQKKAVPEIILSTTDIPVELDVIDGESCLIEAHICRPGSKAGGANNPARPDIPDGEQREGERRWFGFGKRQAANGEAKLSGEAYAAHISDALPFIHYDLHRQLLYKLSVHGMNAIFGLKYQFSIGEDMIIAVATGTAVYVTGLPTPGPLHIKRNIDVLDEEDRSFIRIQDRIMQLSNANRRRLDRAFRKKRRAMLRLREQQQQENSQPLAGMQLKRGDFAASRARRRRRRTSGAKHSGSSDGEDSGDDRQPGNAGPAGHSDLSADSDSDRDGSSGKSSRAERRRRRNIRARVAVQIDDDADEDLMAALLDVPLPPSVLVCNVERPPVFRHFVIPELVDNGQCLLEDIDLSSSSSSSSSSGSTDTDSTSSTDSSTSMAMHRLRDMDPDQIQTIVMVKRATVDPYSKHPNRQLAELFSNIYTDLYMTLVYFELCAIVGIDYNVQVMDDEPHDVQVVLSATIVGQCDVVLPRYSINAHLSHDASHVMSQAVNVELERQTLRVVSSDLMPHPMSPGGSRMFTPSLRSDHIEMADGRTPIALTTLSYLPRRTITAHVGRISLHFVQESYIDSQSKGPVGMGAFVVSFVAEVQAVVRAHVAARGGMALVALCVESVQFVRDERSHAYAALSVSGDVVRYTQE
ncbi:hypothetical protein EC988_001344, partial [Linderina pennispora]